MVRRRVCLAPRVQGFVAGATPFDESVLARVVGLAHETSEIHRFQFIAEMGEPLLGRAVGVGGEATEKPVLDRHRPHLVGHDAALVAAPTPVDIGELGRCNDQPLTEE